MGDHHGHHMPGHNMGDMTTSSNHSGHNMSTTTIHSMPGMHGGMHMFFSTAWEQTYLLFKSWQLNEVWQLAVACVCIAIVAALYEGLKVFRERLLVCYGGAGSNYSPSNKGGRSGRIRMCTLSHLVQTLLHILQVTVSYLLMLAVMTFNLWIGLSVVLGAGVGYFLFGWKRAIVNDVNEHCH